MAEKGKEFPLSIVVRTVDRATAGLRRVNERIDRLTAPVRRLGAGVGAVGASLGALSRESGLPRLMAGFAGVGREVRGLAFGLGGLAVAAGFGTAAIVGMINEGDKLAKTADRVGLTIDALAQLRFAASQSGVEDLDGALEKFNKGLGEAKAGTGQLASFLQKVSPALLKQVKAASSTEEAFGLMADAMTKIKEPAKRAAFATAIFGRAGQPLINMLAGGKAGIEELKKEFARLAGPQEEAARKSELMQDAMGRITASMAGVKAAVLTGLAPAFLQIAEQLKEFFVANRERIAEWVKDFGEKLPARIDAVVGAFKGLVSMGKSVVNILGGTRNAAVALALFLSRGLVAAILKLSVVMLTTPIGWIITGIGLLIAAGVLLVQNWDKVKLFLVSMWEVVKENFATIWGWIKTALAWTPLGPIIEHWSPISDFFATLWGGITSVFETAWSIIKTIVDKVVGAVETVVDAAKAIRDFFSADESTPFPMLRDLRRQLDERRRVGAEGAATRPSAPPRDTKAKIEVGFVNAPKGMRVTADPRGTADVDLSVGYQLVTP